MNSSRLGLPRLGFSFTEVVIAVLIIGACTVPIFFLFNRGSSGTIQTRDEVWAYNYATDLLDFARTKAFDDAFLTPTPPEGKLLPELALTGGGTAGNVTLKMEDKFERKLHVRVPATPANWPYTYKVLVAEINWKVSDKPRKIEVAGLLSKGK